MEEEISISGREDKKDGKAWIKPRIRFCYGVFVFIANKIKSGEARQNENYGTLPLDAGNHVQHTAFMMRNLVKIFIHF